MQVKLKLILLGDQGVGKTSLLVRFEKNSFQEHYDATIIDVFCKEIKIKGIDVKVDIFDTAGQERYKSIAKSYFRNIDGVLLVYDVLCCTSFHMMCNWLNELRCMNEDAEVLIVGNKIDVHVENQVAVTFAKNFCVSENLEFMEASAKSGKNVDLVFRRLIEKVLYAKGILKEDKKEIITNDSEERDDISNGCSEENYESATNTTASNADRSTFQVSDAFSLRDEPLPQKQKKCC